MIRRLLPFAFLALWATPVAAQLGAVPHTFVSGTTILAAEVNINFSTAYANSCNRTGCTMTGLLTSQQLTPAATNTYDLGTTLTRFRDLWLSRNATIAGDLSMVGTISDSNSEATVADQFLVISTVAPQMQVRFDISNYWESTISSAGAVTFNAVGASQGFTFSDTVTATSFATASGAWTFTASPLITNALPNVHLFETSATANEGRWKLLADTDNFVLTLANDADTANGAAFTVTRTGTVADLFSIGATQLGTLDGTAAAPTHTFASDLDTGLYRIAANQLGISIGGAKALDFSTAAGSHTIAPGIDAGGGVGTTLGSTLARFRQLYLGDGTNAADGLAFYETLGSVGRVQFDNGAFLVTGPGSGFSFSTTGELALNTGTASSLVMTEVASSSTGGALTSSAQARMYVKGDQLIVQFNDAGTMRYKWMPLAGVSVTWTHQTTEP